VRKYAEIWYNGQARTDINANFHGFQPSNKPNEKRVGPEGKQNHVLKIFCRKRDLVTIMACTNASDNFFQPVARFKEKECPSEFSGDFPNIVFFAMTDLTGKSRKAVMIRQSYFQAHRIAGHCLLL
jgi:hypothetical protein